MDRSTDTVRIPRADLQRLETWLIATVRRLADTPGVETQALSLEGESVLDLCSAWAKDDTLVALWGEGGVRSALPSPSKANGKAAGQ